MGIVGVGSDAAHPRAGVVTAMSSAALENSEPRAFRLRRDDLLVKAITVQGGETDIAGERKAFARIVMTGVTWDNAGESPATRRQRTAVLDLERAEELVAGLHEVLNSMARSTPTPLTPAMGPWSWTSVPLHDDDLLVLQTDANGISIPGAAGVTPTVRVDFSGTPAQALTSEDPAVHVHGAIFAGPRQVLTLISSLKKVVRSALEQRRVEVYVSSERAYLSATSSFTTFGF